MLIIRQFDLFFSKEALSFLGFLPLVFASKFLLQKFCMYKTLGGGGTKILIAEMNAVCRKNLEAKICYLKLKVKKPKKDNASLEENKSTFLIISMHYQNKVRRAEPPPPPTFRNF